MPSYLNRGLFKIVIKGPVAGIEQMVRLHGIYSVIGLIVGLLAALGGLILTLLGATGSITWEFKFLTSESNLEQATPGVILMVIGVMVIVVTRFSVRIDTTNEWQETPREPTREDNDK